MSELPDAPLAIGGPTTRNTDCDQNYDSTKALDVTVHCASQAGFGDFMEHLLNSDDPVVQAKLQERLERMQPGNTDAVANTRAVRLSLSAVMPPAKSIDGVAGEVLAADSDMTSNLAVANFSGVSQIVCLSALGAPGRNKRSEVSITGPGGAQPLMVTNSSKFIQNFSTGSTVESV